MTLCTCQQNNYMIVLFDEINNAFPANKADLKSCITGHNKVELKSAALQVSVKLTLNNP